MRRVVGLDINGWHDRAWRSWMRTECGLEDVAGGHMVEGGYAGAAVNLTDGAPGRPGRRRRNPWVGGPQAMLAPHGQGDGFGAVGAAPRHSLRDAASPDELRHVTAATISALAGDGEIGVLAIPDDGTCDEARREILIDALAQAGLRRRLLVWRPVLACLARPKLVGQDGCLLVVSQVEAGLALQRLILRQDDGLDVPERERAGEVKVSAWGLRPREAAARAALQAGRDLRFGLDAAIGRSDLAVRMALGADPIPRLVRKATREWVAFDPGAWNADGDTGLATSDAGDVDAVLLESLLEGSARAKLVHRLARDLGRPIDPGDGTDVARGAHEAALRVLRGAPVYYDFLPQVQTICDGDSGPHAVDLVEPGARLRAGEVYRSDVAARFGVRAGQHRIVVWLRRAEEAPRRAEVSVVPATRNAEVALHLEQMPAAGRARLSLRSATWPIPQDVRWEDAEPDPRDWDAIIADQDVRPGWPDPWRIDHALLAWQEIAATRQARYGRDMDWPELADWLARPNWGDALQLQRGHLFDSDGQPAAGADPAVVTWIDRQLANGLEILDSAEHGRWSPPPGCLRSLTWTFARCPRPVLSMLHRALGAGQQFRSHPFDGPGQKKLWLQGIGRISATPDDARAAFDLLFRFDDGDWNSDVVACAAFLLSRIDEAWSVLTTAEAHRLADTVCRRLHMAFAEGRRDLRYGARFRYLSPLLAGLLRRRQGPDRVTLLEARDPRGANVALRLDWALKDLAWTRDRAWDRWTPLLSDLLNFIRDGSGASDLLQRMMDGD